MKNQFLKSFSETLSVIGGGVTFVYFVIATTYYLGLSYELTVAVISVLIAFITGLYSMKIAVAAKKIFSSPRIFLSYSHKDAPIANLIAGKLNDNGAKVWLDVDQIKFGDSMKSTIEKAINDSDLFIVFITNNKSLYLDYELKIAEEGGKKIIPVIVENVEIPRELKDIKYVDLRNNKEEGIIELLRAVN